MVACRKSGLLLLTLLIAVSLVLVACGGGDSNNESNKGETGSDNGMKLPQTFKSANGVSLRYPDGWAARDFTDGPLVYALVANSQAVLDDLNPDAPGQMRAGGFHLGVQTLRWADVAAALGVADETAVKSQGVTGMMEMFFMPVTMTPSDEVSIQFGKVEPVTIGTIKAARVSVTDSVTKSQGFKIAYELDDEWLVLVDMLAHEGELGRFEDIAYEIIKSITYQAPQG